MIRFALQEKLREVLQTEGKWHRWKNRFFLRDTRILTKMKHEMNSCGFLGFTHSLKDFKKILGLLFVLWDPVGSDKCIMAYIHSYNIIQNTSTKLRNILSPLPPHTPHCDHFIFFISFFPEYYTNGIKQYVTF